MHVGVKIYEPPYHPPTRQYHNRLSMTCLFVCLFQLIRLLGSTANLSAVSYWFYLLCPFLSLFHSSFPLLGFFCLPCKPARLAKEAKNRLYRRKVRFPFFLRPVDWLPSSRIFPGVPPSEYVRQVSPPMSYDIDGDLPVFLEERAFVDHVSDGFLCSSTPTPCCVGHFHPV
jgi:hypothetical protein